MNEITITGTMTNYFIWKKEVRCRVHLPESITIGS